MINKGALTSNTRIVLAFASFNFDSTSYIPGLNNISMSDVLNLTNTIHQYGAKVSLSIGGATYPFANSDLYQRPGDLANNINQVLKSTGFDGVDFDIEDSYTSVSSDFANQAASLINTLRSLNKDIYISLTTPGQAWSDSMYQRNLLNMTIGNINAWQPMEYDIWIDTLNSYKSQIQWDINYYINNWGVSPSKIILGLMPGKDDGTNILRLQDALDLTSFTLNKSLQGVMTWDVNIDSKGVDDNSPYAYTMGIQSQLKNTNIRRCTLM